MRGSSEGNGRVHDPADAVKLGVTWGVIGASAMAMYAMVAAATYQGTGFFTPTYHIASTIIDPEPMMQSMEAAAGGDQFFFRLGPAMTGVAIHLAVGVAYGVVFALIAQRLTLTGGLALGAGMAYGVVAMLFSVFIGLPLAASVFGGGEAISSMAEMVGWGTFTGEHILFGGALGLGYGLAYRTAPERRTAQAA